jgi:ABC-2 type transport system ATP-binding protein
VPKLKTISVKGLKKTYKSGFLSKKSTLAVEDLSFEIEEGEIYGFLGPNGAGKTTTLLCLLGLIPYDEGKITIFGEPLFANGHLFSSIGYVPEEPALYGFLTAEEYLLHSALLRGVSKERIKITVEDCLKKLELKETAKRLVRTYSKGMKQRLQIAEAILNQPKILFLDEPTRGLDPLGVKIVRNLIEELAQKGTTVFLNSHILSEVEMTCTRIGILNKGRMVWEGSPKDISKENEGHRILFRLPLGSTLADDFKKVEGSDNVYEIISASSKELFEKIDEIKFCNGEIIEVIPAKRLEDYFIEKVKGNGD